MRFIKILDLSTGQALELPDVLGRTFEVISRDDMISIIEIKNCKARIVVTLAEGIFNEIYNVSYEGSDILQRNTGPLDLSKKPVYWDIL